MYIIKFFLKKKTRKDLQIILKVMLTFNDGNSYEWLRSFVAKCSFEKIAEKASFARMIVL